MGGILGWNIKQTVLMPISVYQNLLSIRHNEVPLINCSDLDHQKQICHQIKTPPLYGSEMSCSIGLVRWKVIILLCMPFVVVIVSYRHNIPFKTTYHGVDYMDAIYTITCYV